MYEGVRWEGEVLGGIGGMVVGMVMRCDEGMRKVKGGGGGVMK